MAYDYAKLNVFTKSQVNGLTKHLSNLRFNNGDWNSTHELWQRIFDRSAELGMEIGYSQAHGERLDFIKPRKITKEQTEFGKTWLKDYFFKKNGEPRGGKRTEYVGTRVFRIIQDLKRFEFVGVQVLASSGWYPSQVVPIYRAYSKSGDYFDYAPVHWAPPIVMEG